MTFTKYGNIFDFDTDVIIMTTNCFGKFGKYDIEKKFRAKRPLSYQNYIEHCKIHMNKRKLLGHTCIFKEKGLWSSMIFSQYRYEENGRINFDYKSFKKGLMSTKDSMKYMGLLTAVIPYNVGCDPSGQADHIAISKIIESVFGDDPKIHALIVRPLLFDFVGIGNENPKPKDEPVKNPNKPIKKKVFQANNIAAQPQPILADYEELEKAAMNILRERNRIFEW